MLKQYANKTIYIPDILIRKKDDRNPLQKRAEQLTD